MGKREISYLLFIFVIFLFVIEACRAEPIRGLDPLGKAKQNCQMLIQEMDPNSATGELDMTFGDPYPCMNREAASGKVVANRIHLIDGTPNNHACSGNVTNFTLITQRATRFKKWCDNHKAIKCYLSPILEPSCRDVSIVNKQNAAARKGAPEIPIVCDSIVGVCGDADIKETHGNDGHSQIRSNDGNSIYDSNSAVYRNSGSILTLAWSHCDNGRVSGEHPGDSVPPPTQRVNWCTRDEIRQKVRLMREPEPKPTIPNCMNINAPSISKTNAEYYGINHDDGRGNKPMLILPNKYNRMSIQKLNGKEVGCFKYYDTYAGDGQRHYEGNCSKLTPPQLMDLLGGEWGKVVVGKDCYLWNAIRRLGTFH